MLHVGLLGYGRTGRIVASYLNRQKDLSLDFVVKNTPYKGNSILQVYDHYELGRCIKNYKPELIIDFSTKDASIANCAVLAEVEYVGGIVIATTGFSDEEINILKSYGDKFSLMWAPNISDGINILIKAVKLIKDKREALILCALVLFIAILVECADKDPF